MNKNSEEKKLPSVSINWYPGHMAKTKKQIIEDLKLIDIVIELLDARIPISSQNPDIKKIVGDKKKIVVLNKSDLSDEVENNKWVKYFAKNSYNAILVDAKSGKGVNELVGLIKKSQKERVEELNKKGRIGKSIRVMILGIPNVGKSSLINRISKKTSAGVENKPGFTKKKQWIRLSDGIELLDTPGVLWPKFESDKIAMNLSFTGTIKDEILQKTEIAFYLVKYLMENEIDKLLKRYKLESTDIEQIYNNIENPNEQIMQIINIIAKKMGAIISGGNIDEERIAGIIIDDFRTGKIGRITLEKVGE